MIIKSKHTKDYTVIPNNIFRDLNDAIAIGILVYLLSKDKEWITYKNQLYGHFKQGRTAIDKSFDLLIENGYISGKAHKDENGQFSGYIWTVTDSPIVEKPIDGKPIDGKPTVGNRTTTKVKTIPSKEIKSKEINKEIKIPSFDEVKEYAISKKSNICLESLKFKYESWVENGWKDGYDNKIKNWKSKILNILPYIKENDNKKGGYRI